VLLVIAAVGWWELDTALWTSSWSLIAQAHWQCADVGAHALRDRIARVDAHVRGSTRAAGGIAA
jgi:hypothetical protein